MAHHYHEATLAYFNVILDPEEREYVGATEIFCSWFDHLYFPKGIEGRTEWESCFRDNEKEALDDFHVAFTVIAEDFDTERNHHEIEADARWVELIEQTSLCLGKMMQT